MEEKNTFPPFDIHAWIQRKGNCKKIHQARDWIPFNLHWSFVLYHQYSFPSKPQVALTVVGTSSDYIFPNKDFTYPAWLWRELRKSQRKLNNDIEAFAKLSALQKNDWLLQDQEYRCALLA